jgi:gas vesicle protein
MSDSNDFVTFFAGMVIGGLVGAAAAMLFAPQSGEETRAMIRDKSIELKDKAVDVSQDVQLRAEKALDATRVQLEDVIDDLKGRTDELGKLISKESAKLPPSTAPAAPATPAAPAAPKS